MIGAAENLRAAATVVARGPHANADARLPGKGADAADQHPRALETAVSAEAREKVGDLDGAAVAIVEAGDEDGRVGDVLLLVAYDIEQLHGEKAVIVFALALPKQRAEHGIAVETREAGPNDLAPGLDQRGEGAVADEREIERGHAGRRIN